MEASGISTVKKSSASSQQCESDADLLFFFYSRGIVHHEYAPEGQTSNKEYYLQVLRHHRESLNYHSGTQLDASLETVLGNNDKDIFMES